MTLLELGRFMKLEGYTTYSLHSFTGSNQD